MFVTHMPGLMRYPPRDFPPGSDHWAARMTSADFQRVARTAEVTDEYVAAMSSTSTSTVVNPRIGPGHTHVPPTFVPESAQEIVDEIGRLAALGVTWTSVTGPKARDHPLDEHLENLQWVADEIVSVCR